VIAYGKALRKPPAEGQITLPYRPFFLTFAEILYNLLKKFRKICANPLAN
jgi:hypothetical protein